VLLSVGLVLGAGCGGDDRHPQAEGAEVARELLLLEDVEIISMTREEFAARAAANADEISDEELQYYADTYGRLGFFPRDLDLRPVFAGSSSDWVGATYSPTNKRITLVGEVRADVTVHEFVHALQDQHFDLRGYDITHSSDGFLARRAVAEGDAVLAQYRYIGLYEHDVDLDALQWDTTLAARRQFSADTLADDTYPLLFRDYVSFVYTYGLELAAANLMNVTFEDPTPLPAPHDWRRQDALFTERPPSSTQDVLRLGTADEIEPVGLEAVPPELTRYETLDWDSLGEWYTYLLFYGLEAPDFDPRAVSATWDGDRALFVRDLELDRVATVWASIWEDEAAAAAVVAAAMALHGFVPAEGTPQSGVGTDGEAAWIEQRGRRVVVARNLDPIAGQPLIEAAFASSVAASPRRYRSLAAVIDRVRRHGRIGPSMQCMVGHSL
jgi:hypothetical protein